MWVWVLSISFLGSNPEHFQLEKFETKQECQLALINKLKEEQLKGKQIVANCFFKKKESKGWW